MQVFTQQNNKVLVQGDLPTISLPYHFIYLFPKKKQSTISFEVRNFPCPNPVIDSLLLNLQDFRNIYDVQIFWFQRWMERIPAALR